jgi:aminoglycoside phosphotransferase (APT) family kinase protein
LGPWSHGPKLGRCVSVIPIPDLEETRRRLEEWLAPRLTHGSPPAVSKLHLTGMEAPPGGQSSDTLQLVAEWLDDGAARTERLVLRKQATTNQLFLTPDVLREAEVLRALAGRRPGPAPADQVPPGRVPVPAVRWCEADPSLLGAPFFVMSYVEGHVPIGRPSLHSAGWLPRVPPPVRRRVWQEGIETLVTIHETDWRRTHGFLVAEGTSPSLATRLRWMLDWYEWAARGRVFPITDAAVGYLLSEAGGVDEGDPVLVWGDARPGNMICDDGGHVRAAIDWEIATVGPAGIDLGHWLVHDEFSTDAVGVARLDGVPTREQTLALYERLSGRTIDNIEYFEILQGLLFAITLIRAADIRVAQGQLLPGTRLGEANPITQLLARRLGLPVPEMADDYLAHRMMRR